jgi:phenylalanine ammonia-lyase
VNQVVKLLEDYKFGSKHISLNGHDLSISDIHSLFTGKFHSASLTDQAWEAIKNSHEYLDKKISEGICVYGINTGFGGSANVRYQKDAAVNATLITHLNAGFGQRLPLALVKATMLARANSISLGYSGVHSNVVELLVELLNNNIVPYVPKRGSISASGDLMPTSYIAACLEGRPNCKVNANGIDTIAPVALKEAELSPVVFTGKDALGLINASSFAAVLAAEILYKGNIAILLTQAVVALTVEALQGRLESFHPLIHQKCLPHVGQQEVASNILNFLRGTKMAISQPEIERGLCEGELRQDRYGLRTSPQWLGPVLETAMESIRRVNIELNSANDNPIIDCKDDEILHCGNFQGTSTTVAMDQFRQSLQLCGKLLFGLMSEIIDCNMNNGLTPNLCGGNPNVDMGFKGTEVAMASYTSELDFLNSPVSNHVLNAEIRNQTVNSLALISARMSEDALEIFQMQLTNILRALVQAVELRWVKTRVESTISELLPNGSTCVSQAVLFKLVPWYKFFSCPQDAISQVTNEVPGSDVVHLQSPGFLETIEREMDTLRDGLKSGELVQHIAQDMGQGKM